jgi:uncharacterized protein (TIGR02246 family)
MLRRSLIQRAVSMVVVLSPSLVAAQGIEPGHTPLRTTIAEIATVRAEYADAFNRKDVAALAAVHTADGVLIDGDGSMASGSEEIRQRLARATADLGNLRITSDTVRVYGRTAVDIGTSVGQAEGGSEEVKRYVAVLRKEMSGWKLAHVVTVPAGSAGGVAVKN